MTNLSRLRTAGALALAIAALGTGTGGAFAQEELGSTITIGGGTDEVAGGEFVVIAPGVTISGGEVVNETGIGVIIGGGSSVGAATGGGDNAALDE